MTELFEKVGNATRADEFRAYVVHGVGLPAALDIQGRPTQTRVRVTCPFCQALTDCYTWSLCGSGKRCAGKCGAMLGSMGAWRKKVTS